MLTFFVSQAQKNYPKNYFLFPIAPGQRNYLSGNMGEIRSNHFHAGIDIKTFGREELAVLAAADGYVKKAVVSSFGYGNVLHVQHPNGLVTVYAHLKKFNWAVGNAVRKSQYEKQVFELDQTFPSDQFLVKKGDIIGWSGNTGSSGGPHLHFEIRDWDSKVLNPLYFHFPEIIDHTPPIVTKMALNTLGINSRVNGEFGREEFSLKRNGEKYYLDKPIPVYGSLGLELAAYDKADGSYNLFGVSCIEVKLDGEEIYFHNIESFNFDETKNVNAHINFEVSRVKGRSFQKCYITDGNKLPFYQAKNNGKIQIHDTLLHEVEISLMDVYQNVVKVNFKLQGQNMYTYKSLKHFFWLPKADLSHKIQDNILILQAKNIKHKDEELPLYLKVKGKKVAVQHAYTANNSYVFLYDLKKGIPDSAFFHDFKNPIEIKAIISANSDTVYSEERLKIYFNKKSLFDTLYLKTEVKGNKFSIGDPLIPLFSDMEIYFKPDSSIPVGAKVVIIGGRSHRSYLGTWKEGWIYFKGNVLGDFTIKIDTTPPRVTPITRNSKSISFKVGDYPGAIDKFSCKVNGEWILMNYEHKKQLIYSEKTDDSKPFEGDIVLTIGDKLGNLTTYNTKVNNYEPFNRRKSSRVRRKRSRR
ncbi:MAG: M23 family metallopeptidase [Cytophagales bacterium]|nr:M23 family metallopeptidase [Cytophagales bacterium]